MKTSKAVRFALLVGLLAAAFVTSVLWNRGQLDNDHSSHDYISESVRDRDCGNSQSGLIEELESADRIEFIGYILLLDGGSTNCYFAIDGSAKCLIHVPPELKGFRNAGERVKIQLGRRYQCISPASPEENRLVALLSKRATVFEGDRSTFPNLDESFVLEPTRDVLQHLVYKIREFRPED